MRKNLSLLMTCVMALTLLACTDNGCTETVQTQRPDEDISFAAPDGQLYTVRANSEGLVAVPCGYRQTVELAMVESAV